MADKKGLMVRSDHWQERAERILAYHINVSHSVGEDYGSDASEIVASILNAAKAEFELLLLEKGLIE